MSTAEPRGLADALRSAGGAVAMALAAQGCGTQAVAGAVLATLTDRLAPVPEDADVETRLAVATARLEVMGHVLTEHVLLGLTAVHLLSEVTGATDADVIRYLAASLPDELDRQEHEDG